MTARVQRGRCPSGKTRYRNRRGAFAGRDRVILGGRRVGAPVPVLHVYRCGSCAGWHLTKLAPRPGRVDHDRADPLQCAASTTDGDTPPPRHGTPAQRGHPGPGRDGTSDDG